METRKPRRGTLYVLTRGAVVMVLTWLGCGPLPTSETDPPAVLLVEPTDNARGVSPLTTIKVTFSEPMDAASVEDAFSIVQPAAANSGTLTWNDAGTEVTFHPESGFNYGEAVTWAVSTAARDVAGNALPSYVVRSFTVVRQKTLDLPAVWSGTVVACPMPTTVFSGPMMVGECAYYSSGWNVPPTYFTRGSRGFVSFDLGPLVSDDASAITSAVLYAYQSSIVYAPYEMLGGEVLVDRVDLGPDLSGDDYATPALTACIGSGIRMLCQSNMTLSSDSSGGWKSLAVTIMVKNDFNDRQIRGNRSQFRLRFPVDPYNLNDKMADQAGFSGAGVSAQHPYLKVTYEYP